jgi:hypothetical protein
MSNKRKSFYAVITLMLILTCMCVAFIGCSGQDQPDQAQTSNQQPPDDTEPQDGIEPPEIMQMSDSGQWPAGMQPVGGFNYSDDELQELLATAVEEGTITTEQADEILAWWALRPEFEGEDPDEDLREEMDEWMQQKPESAQSILFRNREGGPPPEQEN